MSCDTPEAQFEIDPDEFQRLGQRSIKIARRALESERETPVLPSLSGKASRELVDEPLPRDPTEPEKLLDIIEQDILPNCRRNGHPGFFGYVSSSADPLGVLGDLIASSLNQNVTAWRSAPIATEVERLVVRWLDEFVGFNSQGHGLLVSGGSAANHAGLCCALDESARRAGLETPGRDRMTVYLSSEGHLSQRKAARLLGVPAPQIRVLEADDEFRMDPPALERTIDADRAAGLIPSCVLASAGTTNTGAIDPLDRIADVCARAGLWLHIDGAYGAPAAATPSGAAMRSGLARADSMSIDAHKWLFAPMDAGCVLIRDSDAARCTFSEPAEYTKVAQTDEIERYAFFDEGSELSRRFRALKIWMTLKGHGARAIASEIERHIELRRRLDVAIASNPSLESLGSGLSVSCFRHRGAASASPEEVDHLNQIILEEVVRDGRWLMSPTRVRGRVSLRVCLVGFRTAWGDLESLLVKVLEVGARRM